MQSTPYATVEVRCTFQESALTDVSYKALKTSGADYFTPVANPISSYCARIVETGTADGVDGVAGASLCSNAIRDGGAKVGFQMCFGGCAPTVPVSVINETPIEELDAFVDRVGASAECGHSVSLYDSSDKLGGLIHFARGVKGNHERFDDYFVYIARQLEKNGVDVHLFKRVDVDLVKEQNPDAVVVAVGGKRESRLTGTETTPVFSPEQAFGAESRLGDTVAIVDAGVQAVDFAAYLATLGKKIVMIHSAPAADIDKGQSGWFKKYIIPYLQAKGTRIWNQAEILAVEDGGVKIVTDAGLEKTVACDSVVDFTTVANTDLAEELEAAGFEVYTAGDCADPHNIQRAVLNGNLVARKI